jgi:hypothetical protein
MTVDNRPIEWPAGSLLRHRAVFVYEAARLQAAACNAPVVPPPWSEREQDFKDQFYDIIDKMCGPTRFTSPEEAHDSWWRQYEEMGWVYGPVRDPVKKTHPDMVPFGELGWEERIKDAVFIALCEMARKWVCDDDPGDI